MTSASQIASGMDYTQYSFNNLVAIVTQLVATTDGFGNAYISSTGQMLIQSIAQMCDELNYMLERRTQETYLPTAQLPTSINALASQFGYRPQRPVSATGTLQLQLTDAFGNAIAPTEAVTIPAYSRITYGSNNFVNTSDITIPAGQSTPVTGIEIMEGVVGSANFSATDTTGTLFNQNYVLIPNYNSIEENSINVTDAAGNTYQDVTVQTGTTPAIGAISFAPAPGSGTTPLEASLVYDIRISNRGMMVVFGDNTFGYKPATTVTVSWIISSGTAVNILSTGLAFSFTNSIPNATTPSPSTYNYQLTNTSYITNALDAETPIHIKTFAPDYIRSADRAVTAADYQFWAKRSAIGGIVDAAAYGQEETGLNPYETNNVTITYLTESGDAMSLTDLQSFAQYMNAYNTLTAHMVIQPATIVDVQVNFKIEPNPQLQIANSQLYDIINTELEAQFPLEEGSLGESIYLSDLVEYFMQYETANTPTIVNNLQTFAGSTLPIATYVTIGLNCLYPFSTPQSVQSITIPVVLGSTGDEYVLNLGTSASSLHQTIYTQTSGDTTAAILAGNIVSNLAGNSYVTATASTSNGKEYVTLTKLSSLTSFAVSNDGTTTPANFPINITINLPPSTLSSSNVDNLFLPGSVQIVNSLSQTVLDTDDGTGSIYNGTIDYITGVINIPQPVSGNYYVRYEQNSDENLFANPYVTFRYSQPVASYADSLTSHNFSTIDIVSP